MQIKARGNIALEKEKALIGSLQRYYRVGDRRTRRVRGQLPVANQVRNMPQ